MEAEETEKLKLFNRESLYEKFRNGKRPEERDFKDLIYSSINKLDDGISKSFEAGLELAPQGEEGEDLISFFEKLNDLSPSWKIRLQGEKGEKNLNITSNQQLVNTITLTKENKLGVNHESPQHELDVNGTIASSARIGTYAVGEVAADGQWKTILKNLEGVNAFEMMAVAHSTEGKGKYAMMQAHLLNAYSGKGGRIKRIQNYYSWKWWHRIRVRWRGTPFDYSLEIRSGYNYGEGGVIKYNIGKLL